MKWSMVIIQVSLNDTLQGLFIEKYKSPHFFNKKIKLHCDNFSP